jgi:tRNA 2-thiouridine synthesizing protein A
MNNIKVDVSIDTSGRACPYPVLNTKMALGKLQSGQILEVIASDSAAESDIPVLVKRLGHELIAFRQAAGVLSFFIKKA